MTTNDPKSNVGNIAIPKDNSNLILANIDAEEVHSTSDGQGLQHPGKSSNNTQPSLLAKNLSTQPSISDLDAVPSKQSNATAVPIKLDRSKQKIPNKPPLLQHTNSAEQVFTPTHKIPYSSPTDKKAQAESKGDKTTTKNTLNDEASKYKEKAYVLQLNIPSQSLNAVYSRDSLQTNLIPFLPVTTLEFLNDPKSMEVHLTAPYYQNLRYSLFLDIVAHQLPNDPVNFANIRLHSIANFIVRHRNSTRTKSQLIPPQADIRIYEGILASELIRCRLFLRELITSGYEKNRDTMNLDASNPMNRENGDLATTSDVLKLHNDSLKNLKHHEELIQMNFTNLVRYIINLPAVSSKPTDELVRHYQYKLIFNKIADGLQALKKDEYGNEEVDKEFLLVQAITKVSYDFILLEMYHIHILTKFNNNSIIEEKILKELFELYQTGTIPKVLFFNQRFSNQYAWYFSTTLPFIRLFELGIHNEKYTIDNNSWSKVNSSSKELASYFNMLGMKTYTSYRNKPPKDSIKHIKSITPANDHKPINLAFYSSCLAFIPDNSLNLIQCRDLLYQLNVSNYKYILGQFHRILMKGGHLELPCITLYSHGKSNCLLDVDLENNFEMIPDFTTTILKELSVLFGKNSVQQSIVVLNPKNEVSQFLINHLGLQLYEQLDRINDYCEYFNNNGTDEHNATHSGNDVHYYIHMKAKKQ